MLSVTTRAPRTSAIWHAEQAIRIAFLLEHALLLQGDVSAAMPGTACARAANAIVRDAHRLLECLVRLWDKRVDSPYDGIIEDAARLARRRVAVPDATLQKPEPMRGRHRDREEEYHERIVLDSLLPQDCIDLDALPTTVDTSLFSPSSTPSCMCRGG